MPGTWYTSRAIFTDLVQDEWKDKTYDESETVGPYINTANLKDMCNLVGRWRRRKALQRGPYKETVEVALNWYFKFVSDADSRKG